jgi:transposase-like protein
VADGERESTESWAELLRDLRRRGMRAPVVMVSDGAPRAVTVGSSSKGGDDRHAPGRTA